MIKVEYKETLDYEDISMLHVAEDTKTHELYLCCAVGYSEKGVEYYSVNIKASDIIQIKKGNIIRDYFTLGKLFYHFFVDGSSDDSKQLEILETVDTNKIPSKFYSVGDNFPEYQSPHENRKSVECKHRPREKAFYP